MAPTNRPDAGRPDPDALLAAFRRETAGRLKVFLGAAPGVGKTYAMLQNARRLKDEGVDVVIGLVETHGRAETSALVEGLEVLPRRRIEYHGRDARGIRSGRGADAQAQADRRRRTRPHQRSGQPSSQALAGRAGAARRRRQRMDGAQHPASRESRRRRFSHYRRRGSRDRSRPGLAGGRRRRSGRSHAGRAHPATERRQGLCAGNGSPGDPEFLHPGQPDGLARIGAAPHRRARRRSDGRLSAPEGDRRSVGLRASARLCRT